MRSNATHHRLVVSLASLCHPLHTSDLSCLTIAWSLRNENVNCVLIAPTTVEQLYQQLHSLKVIVVRSLRFLSMLSFQQIVPKLTAILIEEIEKILENKPSFRRLQHNSSVAGIAPEEVPQTDESNI